MIKLKNLNIKKFGSFKNEQVINFPDSGLLLLHGENGSGKSSVLKAIAYCLDFLTEPATDFVNWDTQEDIFVELILTYKGVDLKIQRGNGLYKLEYGSIKVSGSDTPKKIKDLIVSPEFMSIMSYRGQGEEGNFSKLRPSEKQEMLSDLLSLNDFEKLIDKTEENIKILEMKLEKSTKEQELIFASAQSLVATIDEEAKFGDIVNRDIEVLEARIANTLLDTAQVDANLLVKKEEKATLVLDTSFDKEIEEHRGAMAIVVTAIDKFKADTLELHKKLGICSKELWSMRNEIATIPKIENEIEKLQDSTCPTCKQGWNESEQYLEQLESKLAELHKINAEIEICEAKVKTYQDQIKAFDDVKKGLTEEVSGYQKKIEELKEYRSRTNSRFALIDNEIESLTKEKMYIIKNHGIQVNSFKNELYQFQSTKARFCKNLQLNTTKIEELDFNLESIKNDIALLGMNIRTESEIYNSSKDFLRLITEDTLRMISSESSKYVQCLPNAKSFFIKFDTSKLNKNGKIKKEIVLQMYKNGKEVPFRRLSGGEKCSVHLATDLAVSKVLSLRTGKNLGWFILDESLDGMRVNNKIEALNMLKTISKDKLILVVDHSSESSEIFDKVLNVTKTDSGSSIDFTL